MAIDQRLRQAQLHAEPPHFILLLWIIDSEKDFGHPALRLIDGFLGALQGIIDLLVGDHVGLRQESPHQLRPHDRCRQLLDQGATLDAARL